MATSSPLPYQGPDPNPRVPARAWIFLLIAWSAFIAPPLLLYNIGPGFTQDLRSMATSLQHLIHLPERTALYLVLCGYFLTQAIIVATTACLAVKLAKRCKTKPASIIRIAATVVFVLVIIPLFAFCYMVLSA